MICVFASGLIVATSRRHVREVWTVVGWRRPCSVLVEAVVRPAGRARGLALVEVRRGRPALAVPACSNKIKELNPFIVIEFSSYSLEIETFDHSNVSISREMGKKLNSCHIMSYLIQSIVTKSLLVPI